jgi:hypothetical protein
MDWDGQQSALYIDNSFKVVAPFFSLDRDDLLDPTCLEIANSTVNTLGIYGLSPAANSTFSELQMCSGGLCQNS